MVNFWSDMKPMLGYPRLVLFEGELSANFSLEDGKDPMVEVRSLKHWLNALLITENGHCFKIKQMHKGRNLTPWYLRGWKTPSCVEFSCKAQYCPFLSFDNVYPLLWRALDVATYADFFLEKQDVLQTFSTVDRVARYGNGDFISKRMKTRLKAQLEQRIPLRTFFENYIEMVNNHSLNSPYL